MLVMRNVSRHCVLTEIDGGARFVMGPIHPCEMIGGFCLSIKQQTAWFYLAQIHFTFLVVVVPFTLKWLCTNIGTLFTSSHFRQTAIMSLNLKTSKQQSIKLRMLCIYMWLCLSSILQVCHG